MATFATGGFSTQDASFRYFNSIPPPPVTDVAAWTTGGADGTRDPDPAVLEILTKASSAGMATLRRRNEPVSGST